MKGDFSRVTFDPKKHYSAVYLEQGRVITDADCNEEHDIQRYRSETTAADIIGKTGTLKNDHGFKLTLNKDRTDLTISKGHYYIDGMLIENDKDVSYLNQPYFKPHDRALLSKKRRTNVPTESQLFLVYLDGFTRIVTSNEEPLMREVALGGPNTSVREQVIWQVRELPINTGMNKSTVDSLNETLKAVRDVEKLLATNGVDQTSQAELNRLYEERDTLLANARVGCDVEFKEWIELLKTQENTLTVRLGKVNSQDEICSVPVSSGYQSGENQLYRVEIHKGGLRKDKDSFFKWSRENGSVVAVIEKPVQTPDQEKTTQEVNSVRVASTGRDAFLGFKTGDWVEYVDDDTELSGPFSDLTKISGVDGNKITLETSIKVNYSCHPKLRRWDQQGALPEVLATKYGVKINSENNEFVRLESNIEVSFGPGKFRSGEYWLIPARATTGKLEFPTEPQPPAGPKHHYAKLGLIFRDSNSKLHLLRDCRKTFPSLTGISAKDVKYDNASCPDLAQAKTVEDAINLLCRTQTCCIKVSPRPGWESVFDQIEPGQDAHICFEMGEYLLQRAVQISGKGNLILNGCGASSRIIASSSEAALRFINCKKITLRDLYVETGIAEAGQAGPFEGLNGALNFRNCDDVEVERIVVKCGAGVSKAATCITVHNNSATPLPVRIHQSELNVGHLQTGLLLLNVSRAHVEGNLIRSYEKPVSLTFQQLVNNSVMRASIRQMFISGAVPGNPIPAERKKGLNVEVSFNRQVIYFKSLIASNHDWQNLLKLNPLPTIETPLGLLRHMRSLVDRMLLGDPNIVSPPLFNKLVKTLKEQQQPIAFQGIVIGGAVAHNLRILNNTIENVLQGIHIGLSRQDTTREVHLMVGIANSSSKQILSGGATITGNSIIVRLPIYAGKLERHGIFIGNCESLLIDNNDLSLERLSGAENIVVEGVRIWGKLGNRAILSQNYIHSLDGDRRRSFDIGINIQPLTRKSSNALWRVMHNVAPSKNSTVVRKTDVDLLSGSNVP